MCGNDTASGLPRFQSKLAILDWMAHNGASQLDWSNAMDQTSTKVLRLQIGERIRQIREAHRLSIPECAKLAKLHWRDLSAAEQGRLAFPTDALINLCEQLDISPNSVLGGANIKNNEIASNLAGHLYELALQKGNVSAEEFASSLRLALETGQQTGEVYVEDLEHILDRTNKTDVLEAGE